ncbi:MAG: response regulator [Myxococcaceae bacterium]|nr:response regulator [Myxococcaceae bacterium]
MKALLDRLVSLQARAPQRLSRDDPGDETHRLRVGFLLLLLTGGLATSLALSLLNLLTGSLPEGLGAGAGALVCLAVLGFWWWTGRLAVVTTFYGVVQVVMFAGGALALGQPGYLAWLSLGPLTLLFFAGRKQGLFWLVVSVAAGAVVGLLFTLGVAPVRPDADVAQRAFRAVIFVPIFAVIGFLFETVRLRTMESLRRAREDAERANKDKDRFLANVSHEIRTPLNGVLGMTEGLLASREPMSSRVQEGLSVIQESGQLLRVLIDDLLDLARAHEGKLSLRPAPFAPAQLVEEVSALHGAAARFRGLEYRVEVSLPRGLRLVGDRSRIAQVLNNLVANAVKFTARGSVAVTAKVTPVGAHQVLRLSVKDTGPGIKPEDRGRLFKPFGQLDSARGLGGTGLGLAMCHQLAGLMGGVLELDSAPGVGSTFSLVVPLSEASGAGVEPAAERGPRRFAGRALVVDDNGINSRVATVLLSQAGLDVVTAGHGEEALAKLSNERFDIVFMDVHMPVMNGHDATRELRRREKVASLRRIPVIALTASALQDELNACFAAGMDDGLAKPISVAALHDVLRRFLPEQDARAAG